MPPPSNLLLAIRICFYTSLVLCCLVAFSPNQAIAHAHLTDKWIHFGVFFGFALLSHFAHPRASAILLSALLMVFGLGIEIGQSFLPYRDFSVLDWGADGAGIAAYFLVFSRWLKPDKFVLG